MDASGDSNSPTPAAEEETAAAHRGVNKVTVQGDGNTDGDKGFAIQYPKTAIIGDIQADWERVRLNAPHADSSNAHVRDF